MLGKKKLIILIVIMSIILILIIVTIICLIYFIGIPKCVGNKKYSYEIKEVHVEAGDINIYGKALIPNGDEEKYPLVIYAHGAESNYKSDYTTLKSLAMSGIAVYTFDFYGWSTRTTGPLDGDWFKGTTKDDDDAYEMQVLNQVDQLNAVIEKCKTFDYVDVNKIFLLGSSMGGATVATCSVSHSDDVKAIILQFPTINLNPDAMVDNEELDVNNFTNDVLILQGNKDTIVPLAMSESLVSHYNKNNHNHAQIIIYDGQPHVFTGKYKVIAAQDIYNFIQEEIKNN